MSTTESDQLVLAYRTPNSVEARALAAELEDADIAVQIVGDFRDAAYPGLGINGMANKELWVAGSDAVRCEEIVAEWRRRQEIVAKWRRRQELVAKERRKHHSEPKPTSPRKFQFSMRTVLVTMTIAAISSLVIFERNGPRQNAYLVALVFVAMWAAMLAFFAVAWRHVLRRNETSDDEELETDDPMRQHS
jgi:hypothetical protein